MTWVNKSRWFLPLILLVGSLATFSHLGEFAIQYLGLTAISAVACTLLLIRLNRPVQRTLPVWLFLLLFLAGYYAKFFWLAGQPEITDYRHPKLFSFVTDSSVMMDAYQTVTYAFVAFCLISLVTVSLMKPARPRGRTTVPKSRGRETDWGRLFAILFFLAGILMLFAAYVMYVTGIGQMGAETVRLPFRMAGIVFYTMSVVVPGVLLLIIWGADGRNRAWFIVGLSLLLLDGVVQTFLRSSRGAVLGILLILIFLFILAERFSRRRFYVVGAVALTAMLLFPVLTVYRGVRLTVPEQSMLVSFADSITLVRESDARGFWSVFREEGLNKLAFRLTGVDNLIMIVGSDFLAQSPAVLETLAIFGGPGMNQVFTTYVEGIPPDVVHSSGPSLLGWFYMLGGRPFVVWGIILFSLGAYGLWRLLWLLPLKSLPVAQALFLFNLMILAVDGVLDRFQNPALALGATVILCEFLLRLPGKERLIRPQDRLQPTTVPQGRT